MTEAGGNQGPATDSMNQPVIDPTLNVKELVDLQVARLNDLREMNSRHIEGLLEVRSQHFHELRMLEAARIDAIRAVDVAASQQAAKDAEVRATALANQVAASAEAMRSQVAQTATAAATSLGAALVPIQERLAELTRLQYEQQGQKQQVVDARSGSSLTVQIVAAAVGFFVFLLVLVGTVVSIYLATKK